MKLSYTERSVSEPLISYVTGNSGILLNIIFADVDIVQGARRSAAQWPSSAATRPASRRRRSTLYQKTCAWRCSKVLDFLNKNHPQRDAQSRPVARQHLATLQMTLWSGVVMFVCGLFLGVVLTVTREGRHLQRKALYQVLDKLINVCRSIPLCDFSSPSCSP